MLQRCTDQHRYQREGDRPGLHPEQQGDAAKHLGKDHRIGEKARIADALEIPDCPRNGEHKHLEQTMGEEDHPKAEPQQGGCDIHLQGMAVD